MRLRQAPVRTAPLWLLCLTACAGGPAPPVPAIRLEPVTVPPALLACRPEPPPPPAPADDRAVARYILALADAGADCRDRLDRVAGLTRAALSGPSPEPVKEM